MSINPPTEADIRWCKWLFSSLRDGAVWGVPRSGLLFKKTGDKLILTMRAPLPPNAHILDVANYPTYQQNDFALIRQHFGAAGITVEDGTTK